MTSILSYCRLCSGACGVALTVEGESVVAVEGDPDNPKSLGFTCDVGVASAGLQDAPGRPLRPRGPDGDLSWDQALQEAGKRLGDLRRSGGPQAVGIYAGEAMAYNQLGALRAVSVAAGLGTPNLFTPMAMNAAPLLYATELVLGYPAALQADVGRSHFTLLMGVDPAEHRWGPLQHGTTHTEALAYFRRTRKTKLIEASARKTLDDSDLHAPVKPGTELYFLLGLCQLLVSRNFSDEQYLRDHCSNLGRLREWLAPWTPDRVSTICDVDEAALAATALRFSRAPMSAIALSPQIAQSSDGTLIAWAWLVAHALSANLLRPGGLYEASGLLDLQTLVASFPTDQAPRGRVGGLPSLLLQQPATLLADEILQGGEGQVKALICLGDPTAELPQPERLRRALSELDLLIYVGCADSPVAKLAHYVLPSTTLWERGDLHLLDHAALPTRFIQAAPPVVPPRGEARDTSDILSGLFQAAKPPLFGGPWGRHLQLFGRHLAGADLRAWVDRALELADVPTLDALEAMPRGLDSGELDRAAWRVTHPDQRLDLAPDVLADAVRGLQPPVDDPDHPLRLICRDVRAPGLGLGAPGAARMHPDAGFADGASVVVASPFGAVSCTVSHDPALRTDTVILPWGGDIPTGELIGGDLDPFTGAPARNGVPVSVREA